MEHHKVLHTLSPNGKERMDLKQVSTKFGDRQLIIETGKLAKLANGSVKVSYGDTTVLATVVVGEEPQEDVGFFPLLVDYEERLYAAGKISGSRFIKREGRPSEHAVLTSRLIDRPIRPLFPKNYRNDVQIIITVLSVDLEHDPDVISIIAASSALMITGAPFGGPIGAARVGMIDDKFILNPTDSQMKDSKLDLVIAATEKKVMMIEAAVKEVDEETFLKAIEFGHKGLQDTILKQIEFSKGTERVIPDESEEPALKDVREYIGKKLNKVAREKNQEKREDQISDFEKEVLENFEGNYKQIDIKNAFDKILQKEVREAILKDGLRPDCRRLDEIRPVDVEVGLLPRTHGSALFGRGESQILTIATLGAPGAEQVIETMEEERTKRFMHHYNFPPFSTGEIRPLKTASRREIGHGALAERALLPVLPDEVKFPYTIRLVSEVLSSNGSTSMAATCGSSLALMDAGVPIKTAVAGIAIGLITADGSDKEYKILTDIQGIEDFAGDMDFKVAGTKDGITAVQLDTKIDGLSFEIIKNALAGAKKARMEILDKMNKIIESPRREISKFAPRINAIKIDPEKISELIGPGGKNIRKIIEECGGKEVTNIDIEEDGTVMISSTDPQMGKRAEELVMGIGKEIKVGEIYSGKVTQIIKDRNNSDREIGAIVKFLPNRDGMVHISQLADRHVRKVTDVVKVGDVIPVMIIDIDKEKGRVGLSYRAAKNKRQV